MNTEVRELNLNEIDAVSGALGPLAAVGVAIAVGVASNAVYDFMKSHHGIQDAIDYLKGQNP